MTFEWKDLGWILGTLTLLGGSLIAFVKLRLAGDFAKSGDVAAVSSRLAVVEARLAQMPSHEDLRGLQTRVAGLEKEVAVVSEKISGVGQIMTRVERQTQLLLDHQLREEKA